MSGARTSTFGTIAFVLFGPLIWAAHLLVVYGGHASLCETGTYRLLGLPVIPALLAAATAGAVLALAAGLLWSSRVRRLLRAGADDAGEAAWLTVLMRLLAGLSLLGVAYAGIAILLVPHCLQLR